MVELNETPPDVIFIVDGDMQSKLYAIQRGKQFLWDDEPIIKPEYIYRVSNRTGTRQWRRKEASAFITQPGKKIRLGLLGDAQKLTDEWSNLLSKY